MAALSSSTTAKFFREIFPGTSPIQVEAGALPELTKAVLASLQGQHLVRIEQHVYLTEDEKRGLVCAFSIEDPTKGQYQWNLNTFLVRLDGENRLLMTTDPNQKVHVSDLSEIVALVRACQERMMRRKGQHSKDQKI
ncbi:unnamed protein product, partial [Phaeothamnion confervicola]